jgi:hypothetical protein
MLRTDEGILEGGRVRGQETAGLLPIARYVHTSQVSTDP